MSSTSSVGQIIAAYAEPLAVVVGITFDDYYRTSDGFIQLLGDVANRLSPMSQIRDWLDEAADDLKAIARLGDSGEKTRQLLTSIDNTLYEVRADLELT